MDEKISATDRIERVKLIGALAGIANDAEIKNLIESREHGAAIYEAFIETVDKKLSEVMGGKEAIDQTAIDLHTIMHKSAVVMDEFQRFVVGFFDTPITSILTAVNEKLGGEKFEFDQQKLDSIKHVALPKKLVHSEAYNQAMSQQPIVQQPVAQNKPLSFAQTTEPEVHPKDLPPVYVSQRPSGRGSEHGGY